MSLSPNWGPRRHGRDPDLVVLHYTAMETAEAAVERLCDPAAEVSAHYLIAEDGTTIALVDEDKRAWHAGIGLWGDLSDINSHSIGIELANQGPQSPAPEFPPVQLAALVTLLSAILSRWNIPPERVIGHSDMAPFRKDDPGPYFDWKSLAGKGLSIWPSETELTTGNEAELWGRFIAAARTFGYHAPIDLDTGFEDERMWAETLVSFRLRFRPHTAGEITAHDVAIIENLAAHYPCALLDADPTKA